MTPTDFEALLDRAARFLTVNLRTSPLYHGPEAFEQRLDDALFVEYWGEGCEPSGRIKRWLVLADDQARRAGWKPSARLFR